MDAFSTARLWFCSVFLRSWQNSQLEGCYPRRNWVGVCGPLPKTLVYWTPNSAIFSTLFITWSKIWTSSSVHGDQCFKCDYDEILNTHFIFFFVLNRSFQISYQNLNLLRTLELAVLDCYFREFTAAINFPCPKSWLRIWENDVIFSKIPHGLKFYNNNKENWTNVWTKVLDILYANRRANCDIIISTCE